MVRKKGKAPQGRAKQKQKAQKGSNVGSSSVKAIGQNRRVLDYDDDEDGDTYQPFRGFAQSGSASFNPSRTAMNLRHQSIAFVSAGINPSSIDRPPKTSEELQLKNPADREELRLGIDTESNDDDVDEDIDDTAIQINIMEDNEMQLSEYDIARMRITNSPDNNPAHQDEPIKTMSDNNIAGNSEASDVPAFVIDTMGDPALNKDFKPAASSSIHRTPSPTPSNSSEEVILFHGRNKPSNKPRIIEEPIAQTSSLSHTRHVTDDLLNALEDRENTRGSATARSTNHNYASGDHPLPGEWAPAPTEPYWRKKKKGKAPVDMNPFPGQKESPSHESAKQNKEQFMDPQGPEPSKDAEETIASLQADWKNTLRARQSAKTDEPKSKPSKRRGKRGRKKENRAMIDAIFSDNDGSAEEAAYNDYMENLAAQLDAEDGAETGIDLAFRDSAHSLALSGPSMYVDGRAYDDDELLSKQLKGAGIDNTDIDEDWESETNSSLNPDPEELSAEESINESDLEDELEYSERQQWEDEADLRQRRTDNMTDEHLARLFAKQQELGYSGDELILDDGADMTSDGVGDVAAARVGLINLGKLSVDARNRKAAAKRRTRRSEDVSFPDASAFADALDQYGEGGFDIMDYDRPSLRTTKKGRKGKPPPEIEMLSDEELKEGLNDAWENDRIKKRQKKLEREELRTQGLLGSGGVRDRADLTIKYPQGMTLRQVHNELKEFLLDDDLRERAFPPMDKNDRKALHEVSMVLQLTCKSQGAGKNRFPVLYKKRQTVPYSDDMWKMLMEGSSRGFFTNRGRATKFTKGIMAETRRSGRGGGFDRSAVTLRNGEIVGAGAKEIGSESFGHRLMEKMGWTKGQALGKDGDGLLVPVEQRMRVGTAGLG